MAVVSGIQLGVGVIPLPVNAMLLLGLYNVASRCDTTRSVVATAVVVLGTVLAAVRWGSGPSSSVAFTAMMVIVPAVSVWVWGRAVGIRRRYVEGLRERAAQLEREREREARLAAAAERARIAREIHDIVSHSLNVVVVLAEGATACLRNDPDRAEKALRTATETGRGAMNEMRRMLGVLRVGSEDSHAPQPGVRQLEKLIQETRAAGLPVELGVQGMIKELPAGIDLAAYRIVQEALTNARKHAGPTVSQVRVDLKYDDGELEVRVCDDGEGLRRGAGDLPGSGYGLIGIHERVSAYGGSASAGPRAAGGFEVVATLPIGDGA
ncbi:sensor histidine kinase [Nocardia transvalensis]|uniref:sensor histidine kinase n=1 Tax=Nocardia transvalensis TaxID=37333 RepID=UPI0018954721|nr:histidine kinase [Nocardia transvalensis]MBF6332539.1 sensor histidine kinase [Nocardia transvalensis]